ncbi:MAG TPA: metallophosphoesterase family protein [Candidatus Acidoferrales bacterium]
MRYLVISDIHANQTALDAVLAAAGKRWDRVVCLGDVVGYGPDPNEVVDAVLALNASTIRGNHDKASCGLTDTSDFNPVARKAAEWTQQQLTPEHLTYLKKLPQGPLQVDNLAIIHGAINDEDEYVFAPAQALEGLLESPTAICFFGHTHFQGGFSLRDSKLQVIHLRPGPESTFSAVQIEKGTRYLLNPGSVGQPRDGDPRAAFAIADMEHNVVEFWRVPYDIESVQQRMHAAGLPEPLILRLTFGR